MGSASFLTCAARLSCLQAILRPQISPAQAMHRRLTDHNCSCAGVVPAHRKDPRLEAKCCKLFPLAAKLLRANISGLNICRADLVLRLVKDHSLFCCSGVVPADRQEAGLEAVWQRALQAVAACCRAADIKLLWDRLPCANPVHWRFHRPSDSAGYLRSWNDGGSEG